MSALSVPVQRQFDRRNEFEHREQVARDLALVYRKDVHVVVPFGKYLGFTGPTGQEYIFSVDEDGNFTFGVDLASQIGLASISYVASVALSGTDALASLETTLTAAINANTATITNEQTVRATADSALATDITTLTATVSTNLSTVNAAITSEATTRATADSASATRLDSLEATVDTPTTGLSARVTIAESAIADTESAIASVETEITAARDGEASLTAKISSVETAYVDADTALASDISSLTSTVSTNNSTVTGLITSEATTRSTADSAQVTRLNALEATVDTPTTGLSARVSTNESATADNETAIAGIETEITAARDGEASLAAKFTSVEGAAVSADAALAGSITTLEASFTTEQSKTGYLNPSADFDDNQNATGAPTNWSTWTLESSSTFTRVAGVSPNTYAFQVYASAGSQAGIKYDIPDELAQPGWYVLEADVTLVSGELTGADVYVIWDATGSQHLKLDVGPDINGDTPGAGVVGKTYRYRKLVYMASVDTGTSNWFYAMTHWTGAGSIAVASTLKWHLCGIRPASQAEIEAREAFEDVGTLDTRLTTAEADIVTEQTTRATAISAAATDRTSIRAEFATADTVVTSAFEAADTGLQTQINTKVATATYDAQVALLSAADSSAATDRTAIRAEFATADTGLQGQINTKVATATYDAEVALLSAADAAEASARTALEASFTASSAALEAKTNVATNMLPNSTFREGSLYWNLGNSAVAYPASASGPYLRHVYVGTTATSSDVFSNIVSGAEYYLSADIFLSAEASQQCYVDVIWLQSNGAATATGSDSSQTFVSTNKSFGTRTGIALTAPADAAKAKIRFVSTLTTGGSCGVRKILLTLGSSEKIWTDDATAALLATRVTTAEADIVTEEITRAAADIAEASARTALQASLESADASIEASVTSQAAAIAGIEGAAAYFEQVVAASGSTPAVMRLQAGEGGSRFSLEADEFHVSYASGASRVRALSVVGGEAEFSGNLNVGGKITIGAAQWPVGMQPKEFNLADGATIQWAGGAALNAVPNFSVLQPVGVALASGESWSKLTIEGATTVGGTVRLKIAVPGATAVQTQSTDAAGGGSDPDRVLHKPTTADAFDNVYKFRVSGTAYVTSLYEGEIGEYTNTGEVVLSTWFNDGGGWDEGPPIYVGVEECGVPYLSASSETGYHSYDYEFDITWGSAIGQHGGYEFGVSFDSGDGTLTDVDSVAYNTQTVSGERTGSPSGETAKIIVTPVNV